MQAVLATMIACRNETFALLGIGVDLYSPFAVQRLSMKTECIFYFQSIELFEAYLRMMQR